MHAVEAVDEAKAGGGGCGGGSGGGAGQKQGAAAARLRSALEDRVIKLEAARYEERAAVDFFNTAMRVDKCYHVLHDEGMCTPVAQARTTPCGDRCSNCIQGLRAGDIMDWDSADREIAQVFENCVHGGPTLIQAEEQVHSRCHGVSQDNVRLRLCTLMCLADWTARRYRARCRWSEGKSGMRQAKPPTPHPLSSSSSCSTSSSSCSSSSSSPLPPLPPLPPRGVV